MSRSSRSRSTSTSAWSSTGCFGEDDRVELLDEAAGRGESSERALHAAIVTRLTDWADDEIDRGFYARSGVAEYWVVRPAAGSIRVHRDARAGDYAVVEEVTAASFAGATLKLTDLPQSP